MVTQIRNIDAAETVYDYIAFCEIILKEKLHFKNGDSIIKEHCKFFLKMKLDVQYKFIQRIKEWQFNKKKHKRNHFLMFLLYDQYNHNKAIGCIIVFGCHTSFYIRKEYRRQGYIRDAWNSIKTIFSLETNVINSGESREAAILRKRLCIPKTFSEMRSLNHFNRQLLRSTITVPSDRAGETIAITYQFHRTRKGFTQGNVKIETKDKRPTIEPIKDKGPQSLEPFDGFE